MSKKYKAIFFDWDGTAVMSRQAPVEEAVAAMKPLLASGVKLVIVSGTTYDKIASGKIHEHFTPEEASNLYLGLAEEHTTIRWLTVSRRFSLTVYLTQKDY